MVLADSPLCADPFGVHGGQAVPAVDVDHVVPKAMGGGDEFANLQPLCKACHAHKTLNERRGGSIESLPVADGGPRRQPDAQGRVLQGDGGGALVVVVAGPPGAGKTTWVNERKGWGDLVVDVDALYQALGGLPAYEKPEVLLPFVLAAREGVLRALARGQTVRRAWVITAEGDVGKLGRLQKELRGAELVVLDVDALECLRRISQDVRRKDKMELWRPLIERWWRDYNDSRRRYGWT